MVLDWAEVADWGKARRRRDGRVFLQFGERRIYSDQGATFRDLAHARSVLETIRQVARRLGREAALDRYAPVGSEQNRVGRYLELWLAECEQAVDSQDMSPRTLRERKRWCAEGGHIGAYWRERSVHGITRPELTSYLNWLSQRKGRNDKPLSGKTRWNIVAAFHRFCGWLVEEEVIVRAPSFRWPKKHRKVPPILSMRSQQLVLEAIPENARGVFLVMARLMVRPSEAVELR
ncbi:MAG: hypothetical protein MJE66_01775, partial [Proteobacteria bacterium]|nr:hypothetical protein [Pseudomonadota bacterium]